MDAFNYLSLPADADERAVKRAYAKRLKDVRPDVDPQGFQTLHGAYQAALARVRYRPAIDEQPDGDAAVFEPARGTAATGLDDVVLGPPPTGAPPNVDETYAAPPLLVSPSFDFDGFYSELLKTAAAVDAASLLAWLKVNEAFYVLAVKSTAGWRTLHQIGLDPPPLTPEQFDALTGFFGFDDVLTGADPVALFHLRAGIVQRDTEQRSAMAQRDAERRARAELQSRNMPALIARMQQPDTINGCAGYHPPMTRLYMRVLRLAFSYWWAFPLAVLPFVSSRIARFITKLASGHPQFL